ncbi:MAG: hypothetical protein K0R26_1046 [Bacteroidota bacterium]|nr:hypothetical protein [Bacteroidota bacterium]
MNKNVSLLSVLFCALGMVAQSPQISWVKNMGGIGSSAVSNNICLDPSGNIYTVGSFSGTVDFDPGTATFNLSSLGNNDIFISKLDASGNFIWAKSIGGTADEAGYAIVVDASSNVYVTGNFSGTVDFDPGAGLSNLTSAGSSDVFVGSLDQSGNFLWAKRIGGSTPEYGNAIAIRSNDIIVSGVYSGTVDFDPGASISNLTSAGGDDSFILKLDLSGNFIWAKSLGGPGSEWGDSVGFDANGNIYSTGNFSGTADFDPNAGVANLVTASSSCSYISKLDSAGNYIWAKCFSGPGMSFPNGMAVDPSGNVYTIGNFSGMVDFDPGPLPDTISAIGSGDIYISKLDALGNWILSKTFGGLGSHFGSNVSFDGSANIFISGAISATIDFDPGPGSFNLSSAGGNDGFLCKLNSAGNLLWATKYGSTGGDIVSSTVIDATGRLYAGGKFSGTVDFDPSAATTNLTASGNSDFFVFKLIECSPITIITSDTVVCAGNPVTLTASGATTYVWSTSQTTPSISVSPTINTTYTVTGSTPAGCNSIKTKSISVIPSKTLSGNVTGTSAGNMILFKYSATLGKWDSVTVTPYNATYNFGAIESALYVIKAIPTAINEQATYGSSAISWKDANVITHGCNVNTTQNITIIPLANFGVGSGSFSGKIYSGNGFEERPSGVTVPGNPIGGIIVKGGRNPGGQMFVQTVTAADGTYTLSGMPNNGTSDNYFILVDIAGLDTNGTYHRKITPGNNSFTGLDFTIDSIYVNPQTYISVNEMNIQDHFINVFPNPTNEKVTVNYELTKESDVKIELFDVFGKCVRTIMHQKEIALNAHSYEFQVSDVSPGLYFIKININGLESTIKLSVNK